MNFNQGALKMNWLAHVYLSTSNTDYRLGNLIADFIKNETWHGMSRQLAAGISCHRKIDVFTDSHQNVKRSKKRLNGGLSLLNGIAVDVFYDHILTRNWSTFSSIPLRTFLDDFYSDALPAAENFPQHVKEFVTSVIEGDRLGLYDDISGVERAFTRIDNRLSDRVLKRGRLRDIMPSIHQNYVDLEEDFMEFFPQLNDYAKNLHQN